jgi:hypothetical protein
VDRVRLKPDTTYYGIVKSALRPFFTTVYHEGTKIHEEHRVLIKGFVFLRVLCDLRDMQPDCYEEVRNAVTVSRIPHPQGRTTEFTENTEPDYRSALGACAEEIVG